MHYSNGREAAIGDVVRGKGYNIKHEIIGILTFANPAVTTCNCQVYTVGVGPYGAVLNRDVFRDAYGNLTEGQLKASAIIEYGQLDAFVALDPSTGEVLPPAVKE